MAIHHFDPRSFRFEYDHLLQLKEAALTLTIAPEQNFLYYLFPALAPVVGAWFHGALSTHHQVLNPNDPLQATYIDGVSAIAALTQVETLKNLAGISRDIRVYTSKNSSCSSYGGYCSLSSPIISIPKGLLIKNNDSQDNPNFNFSADESLFFIAREVANLQSNNPFIRVISKVLFVAAIFFINAFPLPLLVKAVSMAAAVVIQIVAERFIRSQLDIMAVNLVEKFFNFKQDQHLPGANNSTERAFKAGKSAIKKLIDQNLERRKINNLCELYIAENGDNFLDLMNPYLSSRHAMIIENEPHYQ